MECDSSKTSVDDIINLFELHYELDAGKQESKVAINFHDIQLWRRSCWPGDR